MAADTEVAEFKALVTDLDKEITNFKKDGAARKTAAYKEKKLAKAQNIAKQAEHLINTITISQIDLDPCVALEYSNFKIKIQKYIADLNALTHSTEFKEDIVTIHLQQQEVRLETIRKVIEQIDYYVASDDTLTKAYCRIKLKSIQEYWTRIQQADENFEGNRATLTADYLQKLNEYEEEVDRMCIFLEGKLETGTTTNQHNDDVKLPRVVIPKYSGDYFKWMSFRDLFCVMVKDKTSLANSQKMQMLKTLVEGEAASLISDLTITDANFDSAWNRLTDRYDNNRIIVYKHLNKLITQSLAKNESKSLKKLLDTTDQILLALQNLGRPIDAWDDWIIITITHKLNEDTRKDWERKLGETTQLPSWQQLKKFLGDQFRMMEGVESSNRNKNTEKANTVVKSYQSTIVVNGCPACEGDHKLFNCTTFKAMDVHMRWELAKKKKLCFLCLQHHDGKLKCNKDKPCKKCTKSHSTWLHKEKKPNEAPSNAIVSAHGRIESNTEDQNNSLGLLATVLILVQDQLGKLFYLRGMLDSGSQGSLITSKAASLLSQPCIETQRFVRGIGGAANGKTQLIHLTLKPRFRSEFTLNVGCYVMKKLIEPLPNEDMDISGWGHLKGLTLADPMFHQKGNVDIILGQDVLEDIMLPAMIKGPKGLPMAQDTNFGWVLSGRYDKATTQALQCFSSTITDDGIFDLSSFWELETLTPIRKLTSDEIYCEEIFDTTVTTTTNGQYVVKIPFKSDENGPSKLGESKQQCLARFFYLEKRMTKDAALKKEYCRVMQEYIDMGHMSEVGPQQEKLYYIPHHAVIKPESLTTKTRVVFDASAKTTTGISLNDCMLKGGKQQKDLLDTLIQWRTFPVVFKADIAKMYRMIKINSDDQRYHTIMWRDDSTKPLKEYQLNTVTFGTAAAPFLATRTLLQIAKDTENEFPMAATILRNGFYVDDLIFGADSVETALECKKQLDAALLNSKMILRKWSSNKDEFLKAIPDHMSEKALQEFENDDMTKALGLQWNPNSDKFGFKIDFTWDSAPLTKRKLLSQASKLFDPLGWCAPVILNAKLIMQDVWLSKIGWDELVSPSTQHAWEQLRDELPAISKLEINRWIGCTKENQVQLHGFCDASEKAYSAVVYTRILTHDGVTIRIIGAKTRVAPIKTKVTLPRMELCGAVLLSQLMTSIIQALDIENVESFAWSDSTVALGWLNGEPQKYKTFVANRMAEVQSTQVKNWRYCPSEENPADCASRGLMPKELLSHTLWWNGPHWLSQPETDWPTKLIDDITSAEQRVVRSYAVILEQNDLLAGASSWFRVIRTLAYCLRMKNKQLRGSTLSSEELKKVTDLLLKQCQQEEFAEELETLRTKKPISPKSRLLSLNPFLDDTGVMRVGGRLQNAMLTYENKHPVILPRQHKITSLIVEQMHKDTLHGGPQLMLALLRKKYWIIQGKRVVTDVYKKCVTCKRFKAATVQQMMGNLPEPRVTLERAFLHTGVDYCGPFDVKSSKLRGAKIQKGYIAVFVCLGTRASHLEFVSDNSAEAFLAAFNRFISRRGLCDTMYSDNGTNFVGAHNQLVKKEQLWLHQQNMEIANAVSNKGIKWKFIPPGAPNFGGIWERNVRSVKEHLKKTLKTTRLTFEEYATLLCQIEACLNSRPLQPLTADTENINALTPGHFLIGDALMAPPQPCMLDINANRLDRWKHIQLIQQHFWQRWSREYLNQLQQRQKWKTGTTTVNIGDLVLVKDEQLPPKNWLLGRIQETHPGTDGRIRVVTLRTVKGQLKRPINKICQLLSNNELENKEPEASNNEPNSTNEEGAAMDSDKDANATPIELESVKKRYNLRPRKLTWTMAIIVMIFMMIGGGFGINNQELVKLSPFENNAGIYFEQMGRAQTIKSHWDIYIRFDLLRYRQDLKRLKSIEYELSELCGTMDTASARNTCDDTIGLIHHQLKTIEDLNSLLEYTDNEEITQRKKRSAPLNGLGWLQHELFGVMASGQAEEIDQHFRETKRDSLHIIRLIKNQTSIIDSTVKTMKKLKSKLTFSKTKLIWSN